MHSQYVRITKSGSFRKSQTSRQPEKRKSSETVEKASNIVEPLHSEDDKDDRLSDVAPSYGALAAPGDRHIEFDWNSRLASGQRHELRREKSILAGLRGSDSAMDITKRVGDCCTQTRDHDR